MIRLARVGLILAALAALIPAPATAAAPRYVSFTIGRALYAEAVNCQPAPGSVDTLEVARYAATQGVPLSANVIPAYVEPDAVEGWDGPITMRDGRGCKGDGTHLYLSLADLRLMRDRYDSGHSTSGLRYRAFNTLSYSEKRREACGAFDWMDAHGFTRSRGMFAAANPGGSPLSASDIDVIRSCGGVWGRDYGDVTWPYGAKVDGRRIPTNVRSNLHPDGYYRSVSINGGSCPDWWGCESGSLRDYLEPGEAIGWLRDAPAGTHIVLQAYRFVEGLEPGRWDCRDGVTHRTFRSEVYCFNDYKRILNNLPADYVATDPLTVAQAWGVRP